MPRLRNRPCVRCRRPWWDHPAAGATLDDRLAARCPRHVEPAPLWWRALSWALERSWARGR